MSHVDVSGSTGGSCPSARSSQPRRSTGADLAHPDPRPFPASLRGISDRELLSRVKDLVSRERAVTLEILVHLNEVERRRLHLGLGYPSMFEYCLRHLGYSSSAASRRIHSARCIRDYPEVYGLLEKNEVNLSSVSLVAPILTQENKDDLVRRIRNRSQKEVEAIVADYRPPVSLRDRARPVCVAVSGPRANSAPGLPLSEAASAPSPGGHLESSGLAGSEGTSGMAATERTSGGDHSRSGSEKRPNSAGGPPRLERKFQVQFLASERFMKKFERAKALLSNRKGTPSYEAVLEAALDEFLKDHDPEKRKQRREEREQKTEAQTKSGERDSAEGASRRIPAATRDAVFARDRGRCTFVGSTGKRCDATRNLQIDHIVPYARGGTATLDNLRLLCERHNKHEAERVLGANTVRRFCRRG